ncbi:cyclic nucleotide-binding domain-containing protein [Treponema primitia]|uniref:cyclic nucleotide-binding domain-containing protein n=1 Tax=Treponema primitia TaxID=88058 RepID=UPI0002555306|nr:cyclic nucleotide-binding domain-containing protein [Treponema primitia]
MPKTVQYRDGAVIYFQGENAADKIYLLQSGNVTLHYQDIETGEHISDPVQSGEFFGVKAALGRYPEEENAIVVRETTIMIFSVPEFEQLVGSNIRIIMKMLKIFSKQLRRVHRQTANIMEKEGYDPKNPEQGLFNVGEYYLKNKRFPQAQYIFGRYLTYYPSGVNAGKAASNLQIMRTESSTADSPAATEVPGVKRKSSIGQVVAEEAGSATAKAYYDAVSCISQGKFQDAFMTLKKILDDAADPEYMAKSSFEIGRCLFMMNKFDECIQHFTIMLTSYPKHPNLPDALFFIANSHELRGKKDMAEVFYTKILSMVPDGDNPVNKKAKKALTALGKT